MTPETPASPASPAAKFLGIGRDIIGQQLLGGVAAIAMGVG